MKYIPKRVFVIEDGEYIELPYEEFSARQGLVPAYSEKHFVPLHGMLMEVSEDDYWDFYKSIRRQKYLDERSEKNGDFSYDMLTTDDFNGEDILVDSSQDIGEIVTDKIMLDKLRQAIPLLSEDERTLIHQHFFEGMSQTELSQMYGVNQSNISRRIMKILQKLKELL